jgi:hypothetical protein
MDSMFDNDMLQSLDFMGKEENFVSIVQGRVLLEIHLIIHFLPIRPLGNQQWNDILNYEFSKVVI